MDATLAAVTRQERGKNEARRLRRAGQLPAVLYGGETSGGTAIKMDPKALLEILHSESGINTLIGLSVDGAAASQVLVKEFQVDPVSNELLHVDLYRPPLDRAITVNVPVTLVGEAAGVKQQGGLVDFVQRDVQVECLPTEIPEHIEVDVSDLMIGQGVRLRDKLEGVTWKPVSDPDTLLVHVVAPKVEAEPVEAEAEAEAEDAPAEADADADDARKGKAEAGD
ncbi:MAG: 50S ribosomal protein L25 [Acidobacteria bacterium]|nr:50S ribosomal protein L25 [Acidobacteriota bacterium]